MSDVLINSNALKLVPAANEAEVPPVSAGSANEEPTTLLDGEALTLLSNKLGVPVDSLKSKKIQVSPDFVEKLKAGKVEFVRKGAQAATRTGPRPSKPPRVQIEQRYTEILRRDRLVAKTAKLPKSTKNIPVSPADATSSDGLPGRTALSAFMEHAAALNKMVLSPRPAGAPSILEECKTPVKLFISQHQSPGDLIMLTRAVDDLHRSYPGKFITCMRTAAHELWENNPNHTHIEDSDPEAMWVRMEYNLVNTSNAGAHHFCHGFRKDLEAKLGLPIDQTSAHGAIYLSEQEKAWYSQVHEIAGKDIPFWIIDAGRKNDYTAKLWEVSRFQELVTRTPDITWVQVGADNPLHYHPTLEGDNVIDLRGKTTHRQFIRLMYHAAGVVTPISYPMHLAAAVEMHPRYKRLTRPCVVIAGGREPTMWEAYSHHQYMHTCGALPCNSHGGCWKSRVEPLLDGDEKDYDSEDGSKLCHMPVVAESGQIIPKCMDMITVDSVLDKVRMYQDSYDFSAEDPKEWKIKEFEKPPAVQEKIQHAIDNREQLEADAAERRKKEAEKAKAKAAEIRAKLAEAKAAKDKADADQAAPDGE
jgi:hypothetical protein